MWVHALLAAHWEALDAEAVQRAVLAASAPHRKPHDYRRLALELEAAAAPLRPARVVEPMPKERYDPAAAAEWFRQMGVRVVESG